MLKATFALMVVLACPACCEHRVTLVVSGQLPPPAGYGISRLEQSLRAKGFTVSRTTDLARARGDFLILAGTSEGRNAAADALRALKVALPAGPAKSAVPRPGSAPPRLLYTDAENSRRSSMSATATGGRLPTWLRVTRRRPEADGMGMPLHP